MLMGIEVVSTATISHALETTGNIVAQNRCILVTVILILHHSEAHGTGGKAEGLLMRRTAKTQDGLRCVHISKPFGKWKVVIYDGAIVGRSTDVLPCNSN